MIEAKLKKPAIAVEIVTEVSVTVIEKVNSIG